MSETTPKKVEKKERHRNGLKLMAIVLAVLMVMGLFIVGANRMFNLDLENKIPMANTGNSSVLKEYYKRGDINEALQAVQDNESVIIVVSKKGDVDMNIYEPILRSWAQNNKIITYYVFMEDIKSDSNAAKLYAGHKGVKTYFHKDSSIIHTFDGRKNENELKKEVLTAQDLGFNLNG